MLQPALDNHYVLGLGAKGEASAVTNVQFGGTVVLLNKRRRQIDTLKLRKSKFTERMETTSPTAEEFHYF